MTKRNIAALRRALAGLVLVASAALAMATATSDTGKSETIRGRQLMQDSNVPAPVRAILQRACQDCHSQNTAWPWYSHVPPISWEIKSDVEKGRAFMDLSQWNHYTADERKGLMVTIDAAMQYGLMPPRQYLWMHPEARLSAQELAIVRAWASAKDQDETSRENPSVAPAR